MIDMKKVWKWLDGKKTYIGLVLCWASKFCGEFQDPVFVIGSAISGGGIVHKKVKQRRKNNV